MKPIPELYDEHFEREAEKHRDKSDVINEDYTSFSSFRLGANSVKPLIMELVTALEIVLENGETTKPNADTLVAKIALQKLRKELGE